jgi:hypothetical protein
MMESATKGTNKAELYSKIVPVRFLNDSDGVDTS